MQSPERSRSRTVHMRKHRIVQFIAVLLLDGMMAGCFAWLLAAEDVCQGALMYLVGVYLMRSAAALLGRPVM